jgi:hypothetical protein
MKLVRLFCYGILLILLASGCIPVDRCASINETQNTKKILFIGNSYIFTNDLPEEFRQLACSGNHSVEIEMSASGGWTFINHISSSKTIRKLQEKKWDYVILQEQSEIPAFEVTRVKQMYPAARALVAEIRKNGSTPLFLITWGHKDGLPENGIPSYLDMQNRLIAGYMEIARELDVQVIPVGYAWQLISSQPDPIDLWQSDGSHPNNSGTYLAACVIYTSLYQTSPAGLDFTADLPLSDANKIQKIAADSVFTGGW